MARYRHVILDRDGTLNREPATGWVVEPSGWVWERGVLEALAALAGAGVRVSVVTNQSCVARGVATAAAVDAVNETMLAGARAAGGRIERVLVCPHGDGDGCGCRKPAPGLVLQAVAESSVPPAESIMIGDAPRDLEAGLAAGVEVALVRTGKGKRTEADLSNIAQRAAGAVPVFDDLQASVHWILAADSSPA